jgi:hypothetical protein
MLFRLYPLPNKALRQLALTRLIRVSRIGDCAKLTTDARFLSVHCVFSAVAVPTPII